VLEIDPQSNCNSCLTNAILLSTFGTHLHCIVHKRCSIKRLQTTATRDNSNCCNCCHVPLDFNWILFIFGHISGLATGDGSRNATRHTMTNVDIQMTLLGEEDAGIEEGKERQVGVLHLLDFCHNSWPDLSNLARSQQHPQLTFQSIVGHVC